MLSRYPRDGVERIVIKERKGFIKYALRHGYRVHPVYSFGEVDTYAVFPYLSELRLFLCAYKVPAVLFWGAWLFPMIPRSGCELHTFVGPAIAMPKVPDGELTAALVDKWHAVYLKALVDVFDRNKAAAGKGHMALEVM